MTGKQPPTGELLSFQGRVVIVTGSGGNIGAGIAARLAEAGASVVLQCRRSGDEVTDLAAVCGQARCLIAEGDLSEPRAAERLMQRAVGRFARVDGLVNTAASQQVADLADIDEVAFDAMMKTNASIPFALMRAFADVQAGSGRPGSIVNIASIEGTRPAPGHAHYAASKAALVMLTRAAALELGPKRIRVNAVSPGLISRPGISEDWPQGVQRWQNAAPLGRLGEVGDVADAVLFLMSDAARWITGANLVVDGGVSARPGW
ncbi:MAG: SDR family NAD(P)-dependent oxidoreductase [Paracoccaceae bacterium]